MRGIPYAPSNKVVKLASYEHVVTIPVGSVRLEGILALPQDPIGLVLFAHGSGSGRFSPRNNFVARQLHQGRVATLLLDLLEEHEADDRYRVFDIPLLTQRVYGATLWIADQPATRHLPRGYFGASTGAAAALQAAAQHPDVVAAVVSRGGRPDLANSYLPHVTAPTLLIVGGNDEPVIELNQSALLRLRCEKRLEIVPGATHLFEEPGTLETVASLARGWFETHLPHSS
ncbi:DeoR family transcriptional regulator [Nitrospira sp.]|nr:DeoR family transcriptional regulator [Nitrospira sp.]